MPSKINFMSIRKILFKVTCIALVCIISGVIHKGIDYGIDFTGGRLFEIAYKNPINPQNLRQHLNSLGIRDSIVQNSGDSTNLTVRISEKYHLTSDDLSFILDTASDSNNIGRVVLSEFIGPQVGKELRKQGLLSLFISLIGVTIYLTSRFQWKFAFAALVSLLYDIIVAIGMVSLSDITLDLTVLAAILTIVGYSLNDTIIIFDRIRENLRSRPSSNLINIINLSINQTLSRTLVTSVSTLIAVGLLFLMGSSNLRGFSTVLFIGIVSGTYSSIYIANVLLIQLNLSRKDLLSTRSSRDEGKIY